MKRRKIIIVLIIVNFVLIGIIYNLINKANINNEKQTIKAMTQSENEANLQNQIDELNYAQKEYASNVQLYKKQIAEAITSQGVETSENNEGSVMAENILKILQAKTSDATATEEDIVEGKTAYVSGKLIRGVGSKKSNINVNFNNLYTLKDYIFQSIDVTNYNTLKIKLMRGVRPTDGSVNGYTLDILKLDEMYTGENATTQPSKTVLNSYSVSSTQTSFLEYSLDISSINYIGFQTSVAGGYVNVIISIE